MTEVSETSTGAEIIDFEELLQTLVASANSRKSDDEKMNVLLLQHLNTISNQLQAEEVVRKFVELEDVQRQATKSDKILDFIPVQ